MLSAICRRGLLTLSYNRQIFNNSSYLMATNSTIQSEDTDLKKCSVKSYKGIVKPKLLNFVLDNRITELMDCFTRNGYTVKVAGGAVRDMVLGITPHDVDLATNATPETMQGFLEREGYRTEPTGIKHGTIMIVLEDKLTVEVTTLRIDKVTDGRHAEVEFTNNWELDAARRDFTVNAMFMDKSGEVTDYFNGVVDLSELRIRFVNNPVDRIQEDYLRILRYFRFYGRISAAANMHEEHTITAIRENAAGLKKISKERIWKEFQQIIGGDHCVALIKLMYELGVAETLDLPQPGNFKELDRVWKVHKQARYYGGCGLNPEVIFISLLEGGTEHSVGELCSRWKMSNKEKKLAIIIVIQRAIFTKLVIKSNITQEVYTKHCKDLIIDGQPQSYIVQLMMYLARSDEEIEKVDKWEVPVLPVTGHDLLALGLQGQELAKVKDKLKEKWKQSYYILSKEELLALV